MRYYVRSAYNWLLTAFLALGLVLVGLGTVVVVLTGIVVTFDVVRHLLGYDLLLTESLMYQAGMIVVLTLGLGGILGELGLGATHPNQLKKLR